MKIQNILIASIASLLLVNVALAATPAKTDPTLHAKIEAAIEANDYNAWATLMGNKGVAQKINKDNWPKFVQIHTLEEQGKTQEANVLRKELGLGLGAVSLFRAPAKSNKSGSGCANGQCKNGSCTNNGQACSGTNCQGGCKGGCSAMAASSTNPLPKKSCGCGKK